MAQAFFLLALVALLLALFSARLQRFVSAVLRARPAAFWLAPVLASGVFIAASLLVGAASWPLTLAVLAYTAVPSACAARLGPAASPRPQALDFLAILLLWLPLELNVAKPLVPAAAQGFLHSVAYGVANLLGLAIFLLFRGFAGMKYNLPRRASDLWMALAGFTAAAPVLIGIGIAIGFIPLPHLHPATAGKMAAAAVLIFLGTALPEEILFRALIQNFIFERWGDTTASLVVASVIFGCSHLNNGPQALPNWRYAILATIAGFAYGKVFQKSSSITSSALFHMMVDWTKHFFF
ncbi:MAG: lysostaphin resistance A-like protein [Bryobacteraceae bacterium]